MREFVADLHVHTCLSPCGDLRMSPQNIVEQALLRGIDIIAVCDHNSCENAAAVMRAADRQDLRVLPGMEITSREEVHVVGIFDTLEDALALQGVIYEHLPGENDEDAFGQQIVVNQCSEVLGFNNRLLIGATDLGLDQVVNSIHSCGGLAIAAHIDREGFGIIGQLGYIPEALALDALELSPRITTSQAREKFKEYSRFTFIHSSDAHAPEQIGSGRSSFILRDPVLSEIGMAFRGEDGRMVTS